MAPKSLTGPQSPAHQNTNICTLAPDSQNINTDSGSAFSTGPRTNIWKPIRPTRYVNFRPQCWLLESMKEWIKDWTCTDKTSMPYFIMREDVFRPRDPVLGHFSPWLRMFRIHWPPCPWIRIVSVLMAPKSLTGPQSPALQNANICTLAPNS